MWLFILFNLSKTSFYFRCIIKFDEFQKQRISMHRQSFRKKKSLDMLLFRRLHSVLHLLLKKRFIQHSFNLSIIENIIFIGRCSISNGVTSLNTTVIVTDSYCNWIIGQNVRETRIAKGAFTVNWVSCDSYTTVLIWLSFSMLSESLDYLSHHTIFRIKRRHKHLITLTPHTKFLK